MCVESEKPIFGQGNIKPLPCLFWPLKPLILCDKKRLKCQHISLIILTISQIAVSIKIFVYHDNKSTQVDNDDTLDDYPGISDLGDAESSLRGHRQIGF